MNLITQKQLMADLQISRSTLHRYKTQLGLPHIKLCGKTFFDEDKIKDFMNQFSSHIKLNQ